MVYGSGTRTGDGGRDLDPEPGAYRLDTFLETMGTYIYHFSLRIGIFSMEVGDGQLISSATFDFRQCLAASTDCIKVRFGSFIFDWIKWISARASIFDKLNFDGVTLQFFPSILR